VRKIKNLLKNEIPLLSILFLAFAARMLWIIFVPTDQVFDFANYHMIASNIANGYGHTMHGLPVAWQGSGYPIVLGILYFILGSTREIWGKLLNVVFSMGTLIFCWFIFIKIFKDKLYALIALAVVAFLPQYIAYVNVLGTEVYFTFLLATVVFIKVYFKERRWSFILLGFFIAMAALTRPFMLAYPVIVGVYYFSTSKKLKQSLIYAALCLGVMILFISPWTIRNFYHFGRFIPISYNSGYVLFINNNDVNTNGLWMDHMRIVERNPEMYEIISPMMDGRTIHQIHEAEPYFSRWARQWILQNPIEYLKMGILRTYRTFFDGANDIPQWAANVSPLFRYDLTEAERVFYTRRHNFLNQSADIITHIINGSGFLFLIVMLKKYAVGFFTKKISLDLFTAVIYINFAFFVVVHFLFEGQARYAFPAYIFIIPTMIYICKAISKFDIIQENNENLEEN